ncbi:MAG: hypothetical protein GY769_20255 [bacterium]|nr:hypothetical protein [bacterium]
MARSCYTGPEVQGIDVSKWQGTIDWDAVAASTDAKFVYIRVADGMNLDTKFERNWREAGRVGFMRGFYHFFRGGLPGRDQANLAIAAVKRAGGMKRSDMPPALDFECPTYNTGPLSETRHCEGTPLPPERVIKEAKRYMGLIESRLFRRPIIYTGGAWTTFVGRHPAYREAFKDYKLWRPQYGSGGCITVPPGFTDASIHQYTSSGSLPGIHGDVDFNVFRGDFNKLLGFVRTSRVIPWWLLTLGFAGVAAAGAGVWYYSGRRLPWT